MSDRYQGPRSHKRPHKKFQKKYEEKAIILDIITSDNARRRDMAKGETRLHVIGTTWFTILEVLVEDGHNFMVQEEIILNKEEDPRVNKIIGRIQHSKLTTIGERGIDKAIETVLINDEKRFITWVNQSEAISIRLHRLQLIKGIGPKIMKEILDQRKVVPFVSFDDFEERTKVKDLRGLIKQRIVEEITDENIQYNLFTRPAPRQDERSGQQFRRRSSRPPKRY